MTDRADRLAVEMIVAATGSPIHTDIGTGDRASHVRKEFSDSDGTTWVLRLSRADAPPPPDPELRKLIARTEDRLFRTASDVGAHPNALLVWNAVREHAGMQELTELDLVSKHAGMLWEDLQRQVRAGAGQDTIMRTVNGWRELTAVLTAENPWEALADYKARLRAAQGGDS